MSTPEAQKIATEAVTLRKSHAHAPALDILDLVMKHHHHRCFDFGDLATPPAPFALVVAEAFDQGMTVDEWARWTIPPADPVLSVRDALRLGR
jgi:hypothetical protein